MSIKYHKLGTVRRWEDVGELYRIIRNGKVNGGVHMVQPGEANVVTGGHIQIF